MYSIFVDIRNETNVLSDLNATNRSASCQRITTPPSVFIKIMSNNIECVNNDNNEMSSLMEKISSRTAAQVGNRCRSTGYKEDRKSYSVSTERSSCFLINTYNTLYSVLQHAPTLELQICREINNLARIE